MPIYEYACRKCDHQFELLVRDDEKPVCPSCGGGGLTRLLSVPAAHTAGSTQAPCPAREDGSCDMPSCCRGGCGIGSWS